MTLLSANMAAMRAKAASRSSSYSLVCLCSEEANRAGIDLDVVLIQFEKLYPGELHPLILKNSGGK